MPMRQLAALAIDATIGRRIAGSWTAYRFAERIMQAYCNAYVAMDTNGEHWLQSQLLDRSERPIVAVDVGANRGEWVAGLLELRRDFRAYCYEPVPGTFEKLNRRMKDDRIVKINAALSNAAGRVTMNANLSNDYLSSIYDPSWYDDRHKIRALEVEARTGDVEMRRLGLEYIDLLKVDAEGHDYDVLRGFAGAMADGRIGAIQFEYNHFTLMARRTLRDFFDLVSDRYLLCRLLPRGLEACGYHPSLDDFRQSNWVAVRFDDLTPDSVSRLNIRRARGQPGDALDRTLGDFPGTAALLRKT